MVKSWLYSDLTETNKTRKIKVKSGENRVIIGKANAFRIWRAASSVNWDCTAKELSDETGLAESTVRKICAKKDGISSPGIQAEQNGMWLHTSQTTDKHQQNKENKMTNTPFNQANIPNFDTIETGKDNNEINCTTGAHVIVYRAWMGFDFRVKITVLIDGVTYWEDEAYKNIREYLRELRREAHKRRATLHDEQGEKTRAVASAIFG